MDRNKDLIQLMGIGKSFKVAQRTAGLKQATKALFVRKHTVVEALKDISFSIGKGEIVGYIGPNGAGKSTTIKVMSGILVPDEGQCTVMGYIPWKDRTEYVKHIGVVFGQRSQLWWDVPVIDSFELLRDIYKIPDTMYKENLEMLTEMLDLESIVQTPVRQLSLGQRMRCEIAASLLHSPKLLFLDEPTIGLDAVSKLAVRNFIKRLNQEKGVTVILTTHDMSDIEALADRILMIGKGTLLYDGSLTELRTRFGTGRTLTVDYREHSEPIDIPNAARLEWTQVRAVYSFDTERVVLAELISHLSQFVEIVDVTVEAKAIDEIIVQLYEEHQI
ncbi:ABC transporter ATP-binding protein [Paenibacillus sp. GSMTC-2017]|uniref:ABC transporter ATP-binding protein n=1 Tax=Paenibacillus sp. GSMTC-2017 TaxID=2794350 RepID=UPI0018D8D21C|nr:ATP-binding cassette domain-containing protein [Paenibacillus sp. GSMTC-2017]MBH5317355.1 ABC transporter ATP-binding protein [Paenibacillus sp. GSMTC-2017]